MKSMEFRYEVLRHIRIGERHRDEGKELEELEEMSARFISVTFRLNL